MTERSFHLDRDGHSITVNVRGGRAGEVELLVDGKEVGYRHEPGTEATTLSSELPEDPPRAFAVRVEQVARHGLHRPQCTLLLDGQEQPLPERTGR